MDWAAIASTVQDWFGADEGQGGANVIAVVAIGFSVAVALIVYMGTAKRERRIEKSAAYLSLEMHSSDAFRYQGERAHLMALLRRATPPVPLPEIKTEALEATLNYYFQCLNLFEVCCNFRRNRIIEDQVFASWVAWFFDILKDWHFRDIWATDLRAYYTQDVRRIFDFGVQIFSLHDAQQIREREFYKAVAHVMGNCGVVKRWLDEVEKPDVWPATSRLNRLLRGLERKDIADMTPPYAPPTPLDPAVELTWNRPGDTGEAAALAARVVGLNTDYISHGEIQTGLSLDGRTWAPKLAALFAEDFDDLEGRDLLVARGEDGAMIAFAVVAWEETARRRFAVLEDMAVDPDIRSHGVGTRMMEAVAERVRDRGVEWLFLESGLRNTRAHQFFQRHGFNEISHVFGRRFDP